MNKTSKGKDREGEKPNLSQSYGGVPCTADLQYHVSSEEVTKYEQTIELTEKPKYITPITITIYSTGKIKSVSLTFGPVPEPFTPDKCPNCSGNIIDRWDKGVKGVIINEERCPICSKVVNGKKTK